MRVGDQLTGAGDLTGAAQIGVLDQRLAVRGIAKTR